MVTSTGTFVSCKDYDDDIDEINGKIDKIETTLSELESLLCPCTSFSYVLLRLKVYLANTTAAPYVYIVK